MPKFPKTVYVRFSEDGDYLIVDEDPAAMTDPALVGKRCDPVRRPDGKCVVSTRMATQLVTFEGETVARVVKRRRLRVTEDR